jgi:DNA polymerase-3 subunit gamma/tau
MLEPPFWLDAAMDGDPGADSPESATSGALRIRPSADATNPGAPNTDAPAASRRSVGYTGPTLQRSSERPASADYPSNLQRSEGFSESTDIMPSLGTPSAVAGGSSSSSSATQLSGPGAKSSAAPLEFERTPEGDRWAAVVKQMVDDGAIAAMVRELALQAQCVSIVEQGDVPVWRLRVERETLRASAACDKLQAALSQTLKQPVRIETEAAPTGDTPARRDAAARAQRQRDAEQTIQNDPLVLSLMQQYKSARIVPGSVKPH